MVWIQNILPPVVENSIFAAGGFGHMLKPPDMMFANIPVTPFAGRDSSNLSFEVWKVFQPVVTFAGDRIGVVPIIIPLAVRREMDIPQGCLARRGFLVTDKSLP